jgi:hypothetical protein
MEILVWISKSSCATVGHLPSFGNKCAQCATTFRMIKLRAGENCSILTTAYGRSYTFIAALRMQLFHGDDKRTYAPRYLGVFANVALRNRAKGAQHVQRIVQGELLAIRLPFG